MLFSAIALSLPSSAALATSVPAGAGHSAYWYNPERSGSGLALEVLSEDLVVAYWFTYDEDGNQRWLTGVGRIQHDEEGAFIDLPQLVAPRGGHFGQPFELGVEDKPVVGAATLRFADCDAGTFSYQAFGQSDTFSVQRLTNTMGSAACWPYNGVPGKPVEAWAGQSGAWYDPSRSGAGFSLEWLYNGLAVLTWYTFDSEGNPYWIQGVGQREDGRIVFPELYTTHGARFGAAFDNQDLESTVWGSLSLDLGCDSGSAHYESVLPGFGSGDLALVHLTRLLRPACPYVKPRLTDLYDITWTQVPGYFDVAGGRVSVTEVADDGTAAGIWQPLDAPREDARIALRRPGESTWQVLDWQPDWDFAGGLVLSSTGDQLVSTARVDGRDRLVRWRASSGWSVLPDLTLELDHSTLAGASADLTTIIGTGGNYASGDPDVLWIWDAAGGQRTLALAEGVSPPVVVHAVSVDGAAIVGGQVPVGGGFGSGWIWRQGQGMHLFRNADGLELGPGISCDDDCGIVFGMGEAFTPSTLRGGQAWLWTRAGDFSYLDRPADAAADSDVVPWSASPNGHMLAGRYSSAPDLSVGGDTFIWTQRTGMVSLRGVLTELGLAAGSWGSIIGGLVSDGNLSDGNRLRLTAQIPTSEAPSALATETFVMDLTPKK